MKNKNRNKRSVNNFVFVEKKGYDFVKRIFDIVFYKKCAKNLDFTGGAC